MRGMSGSRAATIAREVRLRVVCVEPPACDREGVRTEFGLQDRDRALHPGRIQADGTLAFALTVTATYRPESNTVRFSGPFAHGTASDLFLYLSLREVGGEATAWIRRLKVPLADLTWERLTAADLSSAFIIRVSGARSGRAAVLGEGWAVDAAGARWPDHCG
jgi:hypothetical protein